MKKIINASFYSNDIEIVERLDKHAKQLEGKRYCSLVLVDFWGVISRNL